MTFAAGQAVVTRTVTPLDDADIEDAETVIVTLVVGAAYTLTAPVSATVTLVDDDVAVLNVDPDSADFLEVVARIGKPRND